MALRMDSFIMVFILLSASSCLAFRSARVSPAEFALGKDGSAVTVRLEEALRLMADGVQEVMPVASRVTKGETAIAEALAAVQALLGGLVEWNKETTASFDQDLEAAPNVAGTITVQLSEQMRGELATKSRVPLQWVVGKQATFSIVVEEKEDQVSIRSDHLHMLPFEGLSLYAKYGVATPNWETLDAAQKQDALKIEVQSFYEQFMATRECKGWTCSATFVDPTWLNSIKHKQSRVWWTIREMPLKGYTLSLGDSKGPLALFALMLSQPARVQGIVFKHDAKASQSESKGVRVHFDTEVDGAGDTVQMPDGDLFQADMGEYFNQIHGREKLSMLFDPVDFPSQRAKVESMAGSAMNFAATMAAGNRDVCEKNGGVCIEGGKPSKVIKFMEKCSEHHGQKTLAAGTAAASVAWQKQDPTYLCKDSWPGRVVWRAESEFRAQN